MLKRFVAVAAVPIIDLFLAPLVFLAALLMKVVRRLGIWRMPVSTAIFNRVGIYPIRDHYYEPMFNYPAHLFRSLREERHLPGIDIALPPKKRLPRERKITNHWKGRRMKIPKQEYTAEFKELAVNRAGDGLSVGAAAKELGLVEQTLRNWVKAAAGGKLNGAGGKVVTPERMELSRLRAENIRLKREFEILKKTTAYFARDVQ